jgi:SAM-dependent methyltransferase
MRTLRALPEVPGRREFWARQWGSGYSPDFKMSEIRPLVEQMERAGRLGQRILDVGSGKVSADGSPYPVEGKKIVRLDIGTPEQLRVIDGILELQCDIERFSAEEAMKAAEHVGAQTPLRAFDAIFFLDILNYVDSRETLGRFLELLDDGGRIIISNFVNMGVTLLFSEKRPRTNRELLEQVVAGGMRIEHLNHPPYYPPWFPGAPHYSRPDYPAIMPVRDNGSMVLVAAKG